MPTNLKTNKRQKLITTPVIGWTTGTLAGISVLLAIDYTEKPQDIQTGGKSVQLALTAPQALELGEKLKTLANQILNPPLTSKSH